MDALQLLIERRSNGNLDYPAPDQQAMNLIKQAALNVPDHANLAPWRFIICEGESRNKLGLLFQESAIKNNKSTSDIEKASKMPLRAPMLVIAIAQYKSHPKVPRVEQIASTSCAVMAMQMAAFAQGYNGIWRTGEYAHCPYVKQGLSLGVDDEIVGFLYLGTPTSHKSKAPSNDIDQYFENWE